MTPEEKQRIGQIERGAERLQHERGKAELLAESDTERAYENTISDLLKDIDFLLSLVKSQEAESGESRLWFNEWPTVNGFYWLRGWRHYGDLPISVDGETFWMMFNLTRNRRADLDDSEDVQFLGPITPYSGIAAAVSMRKACAEKVKSLSAEVQRLSRVNFDDASKIAHHLRKAATALESLSIQEQENV